MYHNYHRMLIEVELDQWHEPLEDERRLSNIKESNLLSKKAKYPIYKQKKGYL